MIIKARLGLTDEELVEQIKENPYLQFVIGLEGYQYSAPFDPSMMVYFRKRLPESVVKDCNERIVHHGLNVIHSAASTDDDDDSRHGGETARPDDQQIGSNTTLPNQGSPPVSAKKSARIKETTRGVVAFAFHGASPGQVWPVGKLS